MEITRQLDDNTIAKWEFMFMYYSIVLNEYAVLSRESKRHKYKVVSQYRRLFSRGNDIQFDDIPLPDDVSAEVLNMVVSKITVIKVNNTRWG